MNGLRPAISLGDGIRAFGRLRPDDAEARAEILAALDLRTERIAPPRVVPLPPREVASPPDGGRDTAGAPASRREPVEIDEDLAPFGNVRPSKLDVQPRTDGAGVSGVDPLPKGEAAALPPIEPLFLPRWIRGIVAAALSAELPDGPPDVERAVDAAARLEPITDVPRRPLRTLRLGVQLLVDRSSRMTPFARDQSWLELTLHRILGENRVEVLSFTTTPLEPDGGTYRRPPPGTPVLLLTDLGIGRPLLDPGWTEPDEWLRFARAVRRADCRLTAFVPYPPARWPAQLARELTIIRWDRSTSAATIRGRARSAR
jgi:hypothetical protein